jgi:hypothetical protein
VSMARAGILPRGDQWLLPVLCTLSSHGLQAQVAEPCPLLGLLSDLDKPLSVTGTGRHCPGTPFGLQMALSAKDHLPVCILGQPRGPVLPGKIQPLGSLHRLGRRDGASALIGWEGWSLCWALIRQEILGTPLTEATLSICRAWLRTHPGLHKTPTSGLQDSWEL